MQSSTPKALRRGAPIFLILLTQKSLQSSRWNHSYNPHKHYCFDSSQPRGHRVTSSHLKPASAKQGKHFPRTFSTTHLLAAVSQPPPLPEQQQAFPRPPPPSPAPVPPEPPRCPPPACLPSAVPQTQTAAAACLAGPVRGVRGPRVH